MPWSCGVAPCAQALSHIIGWRQVLNDRRGVDELADTLARNRLSRETLDAMMESARRARPLLTRYMTAKASLETIIGGSECLKTFLRLIRRRL